MPGKSSIELEPAIAGVEPATCVVKAALPDAISRQIEINECLRPDDYFPGRITLGDIITNVDGSTVPVIRGDRRAHSKGTRCVAIVLCPGGGRQNQISSIAVRDYGNVPTHFRRYDFGTVIEMALGVRHCRGII